VKYRNFGAISVIFSACYRAMPLLIVLLLFSSVVNADSKSDELDALFEKSLEELMTITFETASKYEETTNESASISSIISSEEIHRFGANSLFEVFERITSVYMTGSNFFPKNVTAMRGNLLGHYDNHILLLINGRPIRESYSGGVNFAIYNAFPLTVIDRIEVIRGPGSVLYGTNAYSGVINIITKGGSTEDKHSIAFGKGTLATNALELSGSVNHKALSVLWGVKYLDEDGWDFTATDNKGIQQTKPFGENNIGAYFSASYQDIEFNALYVSSEQDFIGASVNWAGEPHFNEREISSDRLFLDLGYHHQFNQHWYIDSNLSYGEMEFDHYNYVATSQDIFMEFVNHWKISDSLYWITGATAWHQDVGSNSRLRAAPVPPFSSTWYSLYSQLDYNFSDQLKLIAGAQLNKAENTPSDIVPRIAAIYQFNKKMGLKLLYAEAFRAAFGVETGFDLILKNEDGSNRGGLRGNPSLSPETIKTGDAQLYYHDDDFQLAFTVFKSKQSNLVSRKRAADNVLDFINSGTIESDGFEFEGKLNLSKALHVIAGYSYQRNHANKINNYTAAPNHLLKVGGIYYFGQQHSFALFDSYVSEAQGLAQQFTTISTVNPAAEPYHLVTANLSLNVGELLSKASLNNTTLAIHAYNLLDESIYDPDFVGKVVNTLPSHSGRTLLAQLYMQF